MTYSSPSGLSRASSLLISAGIHVAIGLALFANMAAGTPDPARRKGERGEVLVVELLPLPHGGSPGKEAAGVLPDKGNVAEVSPPGEASQGKSLGAPERLGSPPRGDGGLDDRMGTQGVTQEDAGAPAPSGAEIQAFRTILLRHIQRFQEYPAASRDAGEQGTVRVRFIMDRSGHVTEAWVDSSSGFRHLDAESLAAIRRAEPLPTPPSSWPQSFEVNLPIAFSLR